MDINLDNVTFGTEHWNSTGDLITEEVARKVAEYWIASGDDYALVAFSRGEFVGVQALCDAILSAIQYAKTAQFYDTIHELYALQDWVLHNL